MSQLNFRHTLFTSSHANCHSTKQPKMLFVMVNKLATIIGLPNFTARQPSDSLIFRARSEIVTHRFAFCQCFCLPFHTLNEQMCISSIHRAYDLSISSIVQQPDAQLKQLHCDSIITLGGSQIFFQCTMCENVSRRSRYTQCKLLVGISQPRLTPVNLPPEAGATGHSIYNAYVIGGHV